MRIFGILGKKKPKKKEKNREERKKEQVKRGRRRKRKAYRADGVRRGQRISSQFGSRDKFRKI